LPTTIQGGNGDTITPDSSLVIGIVLLQERAQCAGEVPLLVARCDDNRDKGACSSLGCGLVSQKADGARSQHHLDAGHEHAECKKNRKREHRERVLPAPLGAFRNLTVLTKDFGIIVTRPGNNTNTIMRPIVSLCLCVPLLGWKSTIRG
jgi:hypothetical protein